MKFTWLFLAATALAVTPAQAQKKSSPYSDCKKSGKTAEECREFLSPTQQKTRKTVDDLGQKSGEYARQQQRENEQWRREMQRR